MLRRQGRTLLALVVLVGIALQLALVPAFVAGRPALSSSLFARPKVEVNPQIGNAGNVRSDRALTARRLFGLGTSELLVILGAAILFFGPDALKSVAKEAGKAAGDLKEVPKAFEEGMSETDKTKTAEEPKKEAKEAEVVEAKAESKEEKAKEEKK
mmetsp:Transcript_8315/g.9960  ORF Transcript_8315/g.9960 Transcript_8315/m.9960 type:complete len:156 (+) Transcript_8315:63-530(+)|eukprot:Skav218800  [mRNA]  locus=scaffold1140:274435:286554:+ [translate_table: standard]